MPAVIKITRNGQSEFISTQPSPAQLNAQPDTLYQLLDADGRPIAQHTAQIQQNGDLWIDLPDTPTRPDFILNDYAAHFPAPANHANPYFGSPAGAQESAVAAAAPAKASIVSPLIWTTALVAGIGGAAWLAKRHDEDDNLIQNYPKPSDNNGGENPPAGGGNDNPPAGGGNDNPPAGGGNDNPPAGGGNDNPPAGGGNDNPPAGGGNDNPPAGGGNDNPPAGGGNDNPPAGGGNDNPPAGGGNDNPPAGGGNDNPPAGGGNDNPPAGGGNDNPPAGGGNDNPPAGGGNDNPPAGGDDNPPAGGGNDNPPAGGSNDNPPAGGSNDNGSTTPPTPPEDPQPRPPKTMAQILNGNTIVLPEAYTKELLSTGTNSAITEAAKDGKALNTYQSNPADQEIMVGDLNNLSHAVRAELSLFVAGLLNPIREKWGVGKFKVTQGALKFAQDVADEYTANGKSIWDGNGHYDDGIKRAAAKHGLNANGNYYENMGGRYGKDLSLDALKAQVYDTVASMLFEDGKSQHGHAKSLLNANANYEEDIDYLGLDTSSVNDSQFSIHFLSAADNDVYIKNRDQFDFTPVTEVNPSMYHGEPMPQPIDEPPVPQPQPAPSDDSSTAPPATAENGGDAEQDTPSEAASTWKETLPVSGPALSDVLDSSEFDYIAGNTPVGSDVSDHAPETHYSIDNTMLAPAHDATPFEML
ncbi:SEC10/PgrA surface exclusion domain-containing protein [Conchiformibius kuhniae]|uniref:SEC10/PgrA surface exclusion domain-containing protein n=1 Tax=Conchiformibius kuhniae TaxID=211502 RepID=A0A8T9MVI1_9NEIS